MTKIDSKIPEGPVAEKWTNYKAHQKLVNPANKRRLDIIVVGTGLAGASAAASLGEMGFRVFNFCIQDSPRRAHSIAAQGGINAAKNYQNDGDSVYRLFYDTVKGGDYRAREANVYRLAEVSNDIIDQCVAQGVPFAREYGGMLANRSFGGAQVSRTFYAKGQTGQQLLPFFLHKHPPPKVTSVSPIIWPQRSIYALPAVLQIVEPEMGALTFSFGRATISITKKPMQRSVFDAAFRSSPSTL